MFKSSSEISNEYKQCWCYQWNCLRFTAELTLKLKWIVCDEYFDIATISKNIKHTKKGLNVAGKFWNLSLFNIESTRIKVKKLVYLNDFDVKHYSEQKIVLLHTSKCVEFQIKLILCWTLLPNYTILCKPQRIWLRPFEDKMVTARLVSMLAMYTYRLLS